MTDLDQQIEDLIRGPQYLMPQHEKDAVLTPILQAQCRDMADRCPAYRRFLDRLGGDPAAWTKPADLPPLPVAMFKHFLLSGVPPERVVRELHSSSTTGQQPSRIVVDKTTGFRQSRALVSILKEHLGTQRRPFLVLDAGNPLPRATASRPAAPPFAASPISRQKPSSPCANPPRANSRRSGT